MIPATFKDWVLTIFWICSLKNTFRNRSSAVKLTEIKVLVLLWFWCYCGKFHKYEMHFIQTFFRKAYKCSGLSLPSSLISKEYVCKIKQICFFSCFSYFLVLHWLCFMMSCWYCKIWIAVCKIIQLKKLNDSKIPILSKVEETKRLV